MLTYTTVDGEVFDLTDLTDEERRFLDRCLADYRANIDFETFANRVTGNENPLVRAAGGRVTHAVWDHPLFQAVRDLEDRLGVKQGEVLAEPGKDVTADPLADAWLPASEAARQKGVTLPGLHGAIRRGDVIARPRPGGKRLIVSARSLERWAPNEARQTAGRRTSAGAAARVPRGDRTRAVG